MSCEKSSHEDLDVATGALSAAERSYPKSEVRGRSREDPMPKGGGQEELPHDRGLGQRQRVPGCNRAGTAKRSHPVPEARGGGREEQPKERWLRRHKRT